MDMHFIYSPVDGHLDDFLFGAIANIPALQAQVFAWTDSAIWTAKWHLIQMFIIQMLKSFWLL